MCAKNHLLIFSSFLDIWENVEWPRFLDHPVGDYFISVRPHDATVQLMTNFHIANPITRTNGVDSFRYLGSVIDRWSRGSKSVTLGNALINENARNPPSLHRNM